MRIQKNEAYNELQLDKDLRLIKLETSTVCRSESSEDCYCELTQALQDALTVIERSLKE